MASQELAQENTQGASPEAPQTIKYEIGVNWGWRKIKVKAKMLEGENKWDTLQVIDAVATLLSKYMHNIPNISSIRGNRLVASWVISLLDAHSCSGTLTVVLYKEGTLSLRDELYTQKITDVNGEKWMVESANVNISCTTNKYSHEISLSFDHNRIVDRYNNRETECRDECSSLPVQVKVNKIYEMLLTIVQALPLIGWYTGKVLVSEDD